MASAQNTHSYVGMDVYVPDNLEQYLTDFYKHVNTDKAVNVQDIVKRYKGAEFKLFNNLLKKYGKDPWPRLKPAVVSPPPVSKQQNPDSEPSTLPEARQKALNDLRKEINSLRDSVHEYSKENETLKKTNEELQAKCMKYDRELEEKNQVLKSLEDDFYHIQDDSEKYKIELTNLREELTCVKALISQLKEKETTLIATLQERDDEIAALQNQLKEKPQSAESSAAVDSLKEQVMCLEADLQAAQQREEEMKAAQETMTEEKVQLETELATVKAQSAQNLQKAQSLRQAKEELEKECSALDQQFADQLLKNEQLQHDLEKLQAEAAQSGSKKDSVEDTHVMEHNEELEKTVANLKKTVEDLKNHNRVMGEQAVANQARCEAEKKQLQEEIDRLQKMVTELENTRDDLSTQLNRAKEDISRLEQESTEKEEKLQEQQSAFDLMKEDYETLKNALEDARADCQRNSEELDVLKNVRTNLEQENEHLKEVVKKLEEQPENAVSQLNNSLIDRLDNPPKDGSVENLPKVAASIDLSRFTLVTFLDFLQNTFSKQTLSTSDMANQLSPEQLKEVQSLLYDRVNTVHTLITMGFMPKAWESSDKVPQCHNCHDSFTFSNRKHHCRYCGNAFCGKCSGKKIMLPNEKTKQRVCDDCFVVFDRLHNYFKA